jgi:hypothetical protein
MQPFLLVLDIVTIYFDKSSTSRHRDIGRSYLSGATRRKLKEQKEAEAKRLEGLFLQFIVQKSTLSDTVGGDIRDGDGDTIAGGVHDGTGDEHPPQDTVSFTSTDSPAVWRKIISSSLRNLIVENGPIQITNME